MPTTICCSQDLLIKPASRQTRGRAIGTKRQVCLAQPRNSQSLACLENSPMCAHSVSGRDRKNVSTSSNTPCSSAQPICCLNTSDFSSAGVPDQASRIGGTMGSQPLLASFRFGNIAQRAFQCKGIGHTLSFSRQYFIRASFADGSIVSERGDDARFSYGLRFCPGTEGESRHGRTSSVSTKWTCDNRPKTQTAQSQEANSLLSSAVRICVQSGLRRLK